VLRPRAAWRAPWSPPPRASPPPPPPPRFDAPQTPRLPPPLVSPGCQRARCTRQRRARPPRPASTQPQGRASRRAWWRPGKRRPRCKACAWRCVGRGEGGRAKSCAGPAHYGSGRGRHRGACRCRGELPSSTRAASAPAPPPPPRRCAGSAAPQTLPSLPQSAPPGRPRVGLCLPRRPVGGLLGARREGGRRLLHHDAALAARGGRHARLGRQVHAPRGRAVGVHQGCARR
jgi:hypothetical protein